MVFAKRIFLFMLVNIVIMATITILLRLFNVEPYLQASGMNYGSLAITCLLWGMVGSLISLALSRIMAKWTMGVKIISPETATGTDRTLITLVHALAMKAGLTKMPEVGIYDSLEVNAFATGPTRNRALVAVSQGLLERMDANAVEGVLAHEIAHVANGDMVTMTLVQGVVNAFVMFFARVIGFAISQALRGNGEERKGGSSFVEMMIVMVLQIAFGFLGMMVVSAFSRWREFRADAAGASLAGSGKMIGALSALRNLVEFSEDPNSKSANIAAFKISSKPTGIRALFSTHPPLEERIARLQQAGRIL